MDTILVLFQVYRKKKMVLTDKNTIDSIVFEDELNKFT